MDNGITKDNRETFPVANAGQVDFAVSFAFQQEEDLEFSKLVDGEYAPLSLNVDYSVTGGNGEAGTIHLTTPAEADQKFRIKGVATLELPIKVTGQRRDPELINSLFERCLIWAAEHGREVGRVFDLFSNLLDNILPQVEANLDNAQQSAAAAEASKNAAATYRQDAQNFSLASYQFRNETEAIRDQTLAGRPMVSTEAGRTIVAAPSYSEMLNLLGAASVASLEGYLPLSGGGTVSGNVTVNGWLTSQQMFVVANNPGIELRSDIHGGIAYIDWSSSNRSWDFDWRMLSQPAGDGGVFELHYGGTSGTGPGIKIHFNSSGHIWTKAYGNLSDYVKPRTTALLPMSSNVTWTHGLAATPHRFGGYLECVVATNGYNVGDRIQLATYDGYGRFLTIYADGSVIGVRGEGPYLTLAQKTGGGTFTENWTTTNWKIALWAET